MKATRENKIEAPDPALTAGVIYSSDNGRLICLDCAGASAKFTGRDISGMKVTAIPRSENAEWRDYFGKDMACEGSCTSYGEPVKNEETEDFKTPENWGDPGLI